jgi:hypothetical protein
MSFFKRDLERESLLGHYLDDVYKEIGLKVERNDNLNLQRKGVDLIYNEVYFIDEKAQLNYVDKDLPTFTFELSYLKKGQGKLGWLFDKSKKTTHYFLVTGIHAVDKNDLKKGFKSCKITSINRFKLIEYLKNIGLTSKKLNTYEMDIRREDKYGKLQISELNSKEGCLFFSPQLAEKPINLQLRLAFLIDKKLGKRIFPI